MLFFIYKDAKIWLIIFYIIMYMLYALKFCLLIFVNTYIINDDKNLILDALEKKCDVAKG